MTTWPKQVSHEDMQKRFSGGPQLSSKAVMVLLGSTTGGRIYKRERDAWYLLEHKPRHEVDHGSQES